MGVRQQNFSSCLLRGDERLLHALKSAGAREMPICKRDSLPPSLCVCVCVCVCLRPWVRRTLSNVSLPASHPSVCNMLSQLLSPSEPRHAYQGPLPLGPISVVLADGGMRVRHLRHEQLPKLWHCPQLGLHGCPDGSHHVLLAPRIAIILYNYSSIAIIILLLILYFMIILLMAPIMSS